LDALLRRTHRRLRHLGVDVKVQQELLAQRRYSTTINIYTRAMATALREANSQVARMKRRLQRERKEGHLDGPFSLLPVLCSATRLAWCGARVQESDHSQCRFVEGASILRLVFGGHGCFWVSARACKHSMREYRINSVASAQFRSDKVCSPRLATGV
jgi:hypothetical protein